jgi:hypothetical protein
MGASISAMGRKSAGCTTATRIVVAGGNRLLPKTGAKRASALENVCKPETTTHCPRCAGQDLTLGELADFYLENFSKPAFRALKTHEVNQRALKHLRTMFEHAKLAELTADDIEMCLRGPSSSKYE